MVSFTCRECGEEFDQSVRKEGYGGDLVLELECRECYKNREISKDHIRDLDWEISDLAGQLRESTVELEKATKIIKELRDFIDGYIDN